MPSRTLLWMLASMLTGGPVIARAEDSSRQGSPGKADPCTVKPAAPAWIDRMQVGLYRTTCLTAANFDGLFGHQRFDDSYQETFGRIAAGVLVSERNEPELRGRFRLHLQLPQLGERIGIFIGEGDTDEDVSQTRNDLGALHRQFGLDDDDTALIGLGYRRPVLGGGVFDTSIGSHFGSGFDPYVRGRFRLAQPFFEHNVARLSEMIFWQNQLGAGGTSRLDLDRLLSERFLARWTGSVTMATRIEGVRWYSGATLYQSLGSGRALAWQLGASGETRADVPLSEYGLRLTFRRRTYRDWLFLEVSSGVSWPRESLLVARDRNLSCEVAMEMWFGEPEAAGG